MLPKHFGRFSTGVQTIYNRTEYMSSTSLTEQIDILEAYLEFVEFEDFIPFVVTDPNNCVNIEEYVEGSVLTIDLSAVKAGDIKEIARKINSGDFRVPRQANPATLETFHNSINWGISFLQFGCDY